MHRHVGHFMKPKHLNAGHNTIFEDDPEAQAQYDEAIESAKERLAQKEEREQHMNDLLNSTPVAAPETPGGSPAIQEARKRGIGI
jgi:hypothetical protein